MVNYQNWGKMKKLYNYYVYYDILFGLAKSNGDKCDYYKKIEEKKSLYEYFEKECSPPKNKYLDFYNKCMPYKPDNVLSKLSCHEKISQEQADAKVAERPHAMQHALGRLASDSEKEVTSETSPIGTKVGYSVLGIAPVLVTATALYRYTPIGPWIRKLSGIQQNSLSDMNRGEIDGFSSNSQESGDMFFDNTPNYISYQPM
ncbi:PIR Superfamily Protein [Plasmodium ovale wallikeri]|uniref:PIR Superfamily Protein n=1 Tax=Plasmodium ovale wallikeri TaxID=864142 RepID=A0A1A9AKR9_PLAOA|nr:PIR Superfamily Protein [Plasmodium ovale wallikeri]SBT56786.1 PIR Superfamily Protein [Plasmodium ovale wallikeri]